MKKNRSAQIHGMAALASRPLNDRGFTYLMALMIIMVMGIMLGMVGQSWKTIMQREREQELIFRGTQIMEAIGRWRKPKPGGHVVTPLRDLKDLLQDPRTLTTTRYLRRLYTDPMTGKEWKVITDPNLGITGVASTSDAKPLKVGGFPEGFESLEKKEKYSDWLFVYTMLDKKPVTNAQPPVITGLPPGMVRPPGGDTVRPSFQTK
jgi:type II secretory pathway pseudopilin PulG